MTPLFAGLLSGGVSLLGGLLGRNDAKKQAAAQRAAEERAHELALGEAHRSRAELAEIEDWNREAVRTTTVSRMLRLIGRTSPALRRSRRRIVLASAQWRKPIA